MPDTLTLDTANRMQNARDILQSALQEHDPVGVYLLFSGGHDSLVSTHASHEALTDMNVPHTVLHIDTTVGIPQNEDYVKRVASEEEWPLRIIRNGEHRGKSYWDWCRDEETFPVPGDHIWTYAHLKREAIRQIVREEKEDRGDRVLFVTGVYADESDRRAGFHQIKKRRGAQVWLNPCFEWSQAKMGQYRHRNDLPVNEVAAELGKSGECLCGAYAHPGDLEAVRRVCPALAERLERLADEISPSDDHKMRWDMDEYPDSWKQEAAGQMDAFREPPKKTQPLCHDCTR
jgi:3'-phosphoadenosine 5'-phosphosulfate sulfotransferase (PAPS reductase)/FAD synthetase